MYIVSRFREQYLSQKHKNIRMKINSKREVVKLIKGPIIKIVQDPIDPSRIIAAGLNGIISFAKLSPFQLQKSFKAFPQFCTSFCIFGQTILLGNSSGELVNFRTDGTVIKKVKLYDDCLSSIIVSDNFIVTTGYDGVVMFLSKIDFKIEKIIQLNVPIWTSEYFENKIYIASNPSYLIDCSTFQIKTLKRFDSFAIFNKKIYASSDERGLTCLKNNSNSYIPCNFILPLQDRMMIFSEQCATQIIHEHQMQWKCHRIKQIQKNQTIESGCYIQQQWKDQNNISKTKNLIILGDSSGRIYQLEFCIVKNQLRNQRIPIMVQ